MDTKSYKTISISVVSILLMAFLIPACSKKSTGMSNECKTFADQHWFYSRYIQSLEYHHPSADWRYGDTAKWWDPSQGCWVNQFSDHLDVWIDQEADSARPVKNDNYYVVIGQYDQFQYGWEDTDLWMLDSVSALRETYTDMCRGCR